MRVCSGLRRLKAHAVSCTRLLNSPITSGEEAMRVLFLVGLLGLGACGNLAQIATDPFRVTPPITQYRLPPSSPTEIQVPPEQAAARDARETARLHTAQVDQAAADAWRASPHWVTTKSMGPWHDAIACQTYDQVEVFLHLQTDYAGDVLADNVTRGQQSLLHGAPYKPTPEAFGCFAIPPGTRVLAN